MIVSTIAFFDARGWPQRDGARGDVDGVADRTNLSFSGSVALTSGLLGEASSGIRSAGEIVSSPFFRICPCGCRFMAQIVCHASTRSATGLKPAERALPRNAGNTGDRPDNEP